MYKHVYSKLFICCLWVHKDSLSNFKRGVWRIYTFTREYSEYSLYCIRIQLDWKTISAKVIKSARVRYDTLYIMSHIVVKGMMSRTGFDVTPITHTSYKKVIFCLSIFNINIVKKKYGVTLKYKIWVMKNIFFQAVYQNFQYCTLTNILNSDPL